MENLWYTLGGTENKGSYVYYFSFGIKSTWFCSCTCFAKCKNEGAAMVRMRLQIERKIMNKSWQINNLMEPLCMNPGKQIIGINMDGVVMQE